MTSNVKQGVALPTISGIASRSTIILLFLVAILGLSILTHYGESWDEFQFYKYADHAQQSYGAWLQRGEIEVTGNTYDNYGPAFVIFSSGIARALHGLNPNWLISDLRHFVYFITFLGGVWAFHDLAQRWMSGAAALGASLLFVTQPLFWGHAFISPKDIPFMSLFLVSFTLGLRMADSNLQITERMPRTLTIWTAIWLLSLFILFFTPHFLDLGLEAAIRAASSNPESLLARLIQFAASDFGHVDPEIYVQKARVLFIWTKLAYLLVSTLIFGFIYRRQFPAALTLFTPQVLLASLALGLTTSIRILGPLAGLLVAYYAYRTMGKRSLPVLFVYAVLALAVMLVTWPYLWPDPPARLLESFQVMSQYPWKGQVLFNGEYYPSNDLPYSYLPLLLLIQFTEPVWPLFVIGLFAIRKNHFAMISILIWFIVPLIALILTRSPLYDNTRQIFFILPPVFLVAGLGLDFVFRYVSGPMVRAGIVTLLILPGIIAGVRLHPYEYVYYNSLVKDATGKFESDYWATSYREATNWLNQSAAANANVLVIGPAQIADNYARNDLKILSETEISVPQPDYVVIVARYDWANEVYADATVIHKIMRGNMVFTVIKEIKR